MCEEKLSAPSFLLQCGLPILTPTPYPSNSNTMRSSRFVSFFLLSWALRRVCPTARVGPGAMQISPQRRRRRRSASIFHRQDLPSSQSIFSLANLNMLKNVLINCSRSLPQDQQIISTYGENDQLCILKASLWLIARNIQAQKAHTHTQTAQTSFDEFEST